MSLRIACDLDGTLADMDAALQREAERVFGPDVDIHGGSGERLESAEDVEGKIAGAGDLAGVEGSVGSGGSMTATVTGTAIQTVPAAARRALTSRELRYLWSHVARTENFWTSLAELEPGVVARFAAMATKYRWEVIFLTQRPPSAGETAQTQSQRWLQAHGFELPSVMVMNGSRGKVAEAFALDAVIDDRPENCLDVVTDSPAKSILIWRLRPELVPPGIARAKIETVFSFAEALHKLENLTVERAKKRTVIGRLKSALLGS